MATNPLDAVSCPQLLDELPGVTVTVFDHELRFWFVGGRGLAAIRLPADQVVGRTLYQLRPDRGPLHEAMERAVVGIATELELTLQNAVVTAFLAPLHDDHGQIVGGMSISVDVTEEKAEEERLQALAFRDPLTGLINRRLFNDRLGMAVARVNRERRRSQSCLFWFDLDDFKGVNDRYGHQVGDEVLVEVAARLTRVIRASDTAARIGGDEFAVLVDHIDLVDLDQVAGRFREVLDEPHRRERQTIQVGVSFGSVIVTADRTMTEILADADRAMYAEKADRKGAA